MIRKRRKRERYRERDEEEMLKYNHGKWKRELNDSAENET